MQRLGEQRERAMLAARGDGRAAKQDHRGGKVLGRGDDRAGIMPVERADERVEPRLNLVHLRQHHSAPRPWKSSIAPAMIAGWTPLLPVAIAVRRAATPAPPIGKASVRERGG